jgi:hypothetical protein
MRTKRTIRRVLFLATLCLPLPLYTAGCDDPFADELVIGVDTFRLAAPTVDSVRLGSAIDLPNGNTIRFPERPADALQWDFALRLRDGQLFFHPVGNNSSGYRGARIGESSRDYDDLEDAPDRGSAYDTVDVQLRTGGTYVAQSRQWSNGVEVCTTFAKFKALEVTPAAGTARFALSTNALCSDRRLED